MMTKHERLWWKRLGAVIKYWRRERGVTQEDLAAALGLSRTSVVNIEAGTQKVLAYTVARIADLLKVKPERFALGAAKNGS